MGAKLYATAMTKYFPKLSFTAFRLSCISKQSKGGEGAPGPPPSPLPPLPLPPSLLLPLFPFLNSDLTTVVECNLLLQKPSPPLRMDLFSRHGEGIIWISTIMIGNRNGNLLFGFSCDLLFLTKERVTLLFF